MASFPIPKGHPTLSEVALALSDPRTALGTVTREEVLAAAQDHELIEVREGRIDSTWVTTVYFVLLRKRGGHDVREAYHSRFDYDPRDPRNPLSLCQ